MKIAFLFSALREIYKLAIFEIHPKGDMDCRLHLV